MNKGCLYWLFIGWWLEIIKLYFKALYWIFIGWWWKLLHTDQTQKEINNLNNDLNKINSNLENIEKQIDDMMLSSVNEDKIGEISAWQIHKKYNLGSEYSKNIINRLEEIGYIKKNENKFEIIKTEQEIESYIKIHLEELRPESYLNSGIKDNGDIAFISKLQMKIGYYKIVFPIFVRRLLFSIPQIFLIVFVMIILSYAKIDNRPIRPKEYLLLLLLSEIFIIIPLNIFIRIFQAWIYNMGFKDFMLLPKNWFFDRCKKAIDLCATFKENNIKYYIGSYNSLIEQLGKVLQRKKALAEHYANMANNAENENDFYTSINSCINTLEWMSQFERFDVFSEKPSDDIKIIKDGMDVSLERFRKRMEFTQKSEFYNYDNMEGHDFEYFCADMLRKNGFENVEVTQGSGDHGIDILAEKDGITYAIQCKCYSSNIGNTAIQQAHTGKSLYHKDIAVVLTNRYFTSQAKEEAQALGVKLWDRDKLEEMIGKG